MKQNYDYNRNLLLGCGSLSLFLALLMCGLATVAFAQERGAARYPGALAVTSHSNYRGLPYEFRWDDTYLTSDNFTNVYNWYSITYDMGAEARANEKCILLESTNRQLIARRHVTVSLCNTPDGQMIFVTRSTSLR